MVKFQLPLKIVEQTSMLLDRFFSEDVGGDRSVQLERVHGGCEPAAYGHPAPGGTSGAEHH